jgi:glycerol-3-phosphate acyltransferase PlsY
VPAYFWLGGERQEAQVFLLMSVLTAIMHRGNIVRLWQGTEGKIAQKAEAAREA